LFGCNIYPSFSQFRSLPNLKIGIDLFLLFVGPNANYEIESNITTTVVQRLRVLEIYSLNLILPLLKTKASNYTGLFKCKM